MLSNHLILYHPLLLLPSILPRIRVFSNESSFRIRWPKYWSFGFSLSPSNEYAELISFKIDWFDLLVVQGTLKSLLQHHSLKASILQPSTFFMVHISLLYMTQGKIIALTTWTFVSKVMSLLSKMLSRFVIACLLRSKCLLISWLQSQSAVMSLFSPSIRNASWVFVFHKLDTFKEYWQVILKCVLQFRIFGYFFMITFSLHGLGPNPKEVILCPSQCIAWGSTGDINFDHSLKEASAKRLFSSL